MKNIFFAFSCMCLLQLNYAQCPSNINAYPLTNCSGDAYIFVDLPFFINAQLVSYDIDFGDLTNAHDSLLIDTSYLLIPHTYTANGNYTIVCNLAFYDTLNPGSPCIISVNTSINIANASYPPPACSATFTPTQYCTDSLHFEPDFGLYPCNYTMDELIAVTNNGDTLFPSALGMPVSYTPWPASVTFHYHFSDNGNPYLQCSTTVSVPAITTYQLGLVANTGAMPQIAIQDTSAAAMYLMQANWGDGYTESPNGISSTHTYVIDGTYPIIAGGVPAAMYNYFMNDSMSATCLTYDTVYVDIQGASNASSCSLTPIVTYTPSTQELDYGLWTNGYEVTSPNLITSWSFSNGLASSQNSGTFGSVSPGMIIYTLHYSVLDYLSNTVCTQSITDTVNVITGPCQAQFFIYEDSLTPGLFWAADQSSGGVAPYSYVWDYGDGTISTAQYPPTHTYSVPAVYMICLTITDSQIPACTSTYCDTVDGRAFDPMFQLGVYNPNAVGIEENSSNNFTFYPNPVDEQLVINTLDNYTGDLTVTIYTITGQAIFTRISRSAGNMVINTSELTSGIYFLQLTDGKKGMTKKFVKKP